MTALKSTNNEVRTQAEQEIYRLVHLNYNEFFITIANIIASDHKDTFLRTSAASVFKRLISFKVAIALCRTVTSSSGTRSIIT